MDSVFNFGAFTKSFHASRQDRARREALSHTSPWRRGWLRTVTLCVLPAIILWNVAELVAGIVIASSIDYTWDNTEASRDPDWYDGPSGPYRARLFFFFCTVPIVMTILSSCELHSLRKYTLKPLWVIFSGFLGVAGWVIQSGIEGGCTWSLDNVISGYYFDRCPYAFATASGSDVAGKPILATAWYLPFTVFGIAALYALYLVFGVVAFYRHRQDRKRNAHPEAQAYEFQSVPQLRVDSPDSLRGRPYDAAPQYDDGAIPDQPPSYHRTAYDRPASSTSMR